MPRLQASLIDLRNSCSISHDRPEIYGHFKRLKKKYSVKLYAWQVKKSTICLQSLAYQGQQCCMIARHIPIPRIGMQWCERLNYIFHLEGKSMQGFLPHLHENCTSPGILTPLGIDLMEMEWPLVTNMQTFATQDLRCIVILFSIWNTGPFFNRCFLLFEFICFIWRASEFLRSTTVYRRLINVYLLWNFFHNIQTLFWNIYSRMFCVANLEI